jgi:type 1 glutamine amidotransferase
MLRKVAIGLLACVMFGTCSAAQQADEDGWISLFNGKNLDGWKASENQGTFTVKDGELVVYGDRSHLFYVGPVNNAHFKNFEFRAQVKTTKGANSGIYFHTEYQETGWPAAGYECQVNTTHSDPRKTGSLYGVMDVMHDAPSKDGQWYDCYIKVEGRHILIQIDGKTTVDAFERDEWRRGRRRLSSGTFAIQGHDPKSLVYFRNIQVRPLPDDDGWITLFNGENLDGWKASERQGTFSVKDGMLVVDGDRSHLFYTGPVENANFKNFEFRAQVKTMEKANSGIFFHTEYQETGWPAVGYEAQVNTTHSDPRKTGSLYGVQDVMHNAPSKDGEWFDYYIKVEGKHILIKVDGKPTVDSIEKDEWRRGRRRLSSGTFAIQGHDPHSVVYFRHIQVRPLNPIKAVVVTGGHGFEHGPFFALFQGHDDIRYVEAAQKDHSELFEDISDWDYDVIVLYNMTQNISPKRQANFKALLERGVGLVALHHAQGAFNAWDDYRRIIGARYPLKPQEIDGVKFETGTYKHDLDLTVRIADPEHPITRGLSDFEIRDETYKGAWFAGDNHVLLTVDHPTSDKTVGWTRRHGNARVAFIQLGHDAKAYANPNYRQLVTRAIRWSAGRL